MSEVKNIVAFDCSNTNIRTLLGQYDGGKLTAVTVYQQPNETVKIHNYEYWDILHIFSGMLEGLKQVVSRTEHIDSVGVCTWGIDFGFFTKEGTMLGNPLAYRNPLGAQAMETFSDQELSVFFHETGILSDKINTLFMLKGVNDRFPSLVKAADTLLMVPDIFNYLLTGVMVSEPSELSTSQLYNVQTHEISSLCCAAAGIRPDLIPPRGGHGRRIGYLHKQIKEALGIGYEIPVICVPSHDTASAILAVPAQESSFAYISSGTWALIGTELSEPVITDAVREADLTNELGAFGRITLLKNHAGMFIIQKVREEYDLGVSWDDFYILGDSARNTFLFDVNRPEFFNPPSMTEAIRSELKRTGQTDRDATVPEIIRSFLWSMAISYRQTLQQIEKVSGKSFDTIYIVGGGAKNKRLSQLTADFTGKRVVTGDSESTSYGNMIAQLKYFEPEKKIRDFRQVIADSTKTIVYESGGADEESLARYEQLYGRGGTAE